MAIVLFDHARIGVPQVLGHYKEGTPFMAARLAQVWRSAWKLMEG